ncbi:cell wall / vacuolar inhibitor of fructosidase 2-like [Rutidosis leptorrhynchoides]|uniref:cell wall / vacuolar inhibitor of fructosidase 2-like n=1 Tax=Rutidosis leptorrhynchoides TaxID=125765 RepID=UPI003A98CE98
MAYFSITKMLFFFCIISVMTLISTADDPYELVNKVCNEEQNPNFCLGVLKSDERSKFAKDIKTLTQVAVDVAAKNATATLDYFKGVKTGPPNVLESLKQCFDPYNNVIVNFQKCMKEEECDLISYDIHTAGDEVKRCQAFVDGNNAHDSFITGSNDMTQNFCLLGESLANRIC